MVDRKVVLRRIELIRQYASFLAELVKVPEHEFADNPDVYLKAERCVQLAIQAMLDIGSHIISDQQLERPARYDNVFSILAANQVIANDLATRLRGLAGLRNILVHGYLEVDRRRLRELMVDGLPQFEEYARQIVEFLDRSDSG